MDFRSFIQSKGRARADNGVYVILCEEGDGIHKDIDTYLKLDIKLLEECHDRALPSLEDCLESFADDYVIEPYRPFGSEGPSITSTSCVSLLYRYCMSLPTDIFTDLSPKIQFKEIKPGELAAMELDSDDEVINSYQCSITLPRNSPYRETITSDVMPSRTLAKRSAALKACAVLHQIKELNDNLLPNSLKHIDVEHIPSLFSNVKDAMGTKKNRRLFEKKVCSQFAGKFKQKMFMYKVKFVQNEDVGYQKVFHKQTLMGLLTPQKFHHCTFPIYNVKFGKVQVSFEFIKPVSLKKEISKVAEFNEKVLRFLLDIDEEDITFNIDEAQCKVLAVPLLPNNEINFELIDEVLNCNGFSLEMLSDSEREGFVFDKSRYNDCILVPHYKVSV